MLLIALLIALTQATFLGAIIYLVMKRRLITTGNPVLRIVRIGIGKLTNLLHDAIPIKETALVGIIIAITILLRGALLYRFEADNASLPFSTFTQTFSPTHVLGWFAIGAGKLILAWVQICFCVLALRIWTRSKTLHGPLGDVLELIAAPLTWGKHILGNLGICVILAILFTLSLIPEHTSTSILTDKAVTFFDQQVSLPDLASLHPVMKVVLTVLGAICTGFKLLTGWVFWLFILSFMSIFTRNQAMGQLTSSAISQLMGPLPPLKFGAFSLTPFLAMFLFNLIGALGFSISIQVVVWLNGVVTTL